MRNVKMAIAGLFVGSLSAGSAGADCRPREDQMTCVVTFRAGTNQPVNQPVNFAVFSSTYMCNGQQNKFFSTDVRLNETYVATIVADWDKLRMGVFRADDRFHSFPFADSHAARAPGDATQSRQSISVILPNQDSAQIMCWTVRRGN